MSRNGTIEVKFGGDVRTFRLGLDELLALQDKRDAGPWEIYDRFRSTRQRVEDIQEILRLGLLGAGVEAGDARRIVETHVVSGKLHSAALAAFGVLVAAISGDEGDPSPPKGKEPAVDQEATPAAGSQQPPSTNSEPLSESAPEKSG